MPETLSSSPPSPLLSRSNALPVIKSPTPVRPLIKPFGFSSVLTPVSVEGVSVDPLISLANTAPGLIEFDAESESLSLPQKKSPSLSVNDFFPLLELDPGELLELDPVSDPSEVTVPLSLVPLPSIESLPPVVSEVVSPDSATLSAKFELSDVSVPDTSPPESPPSGGNGVSCPYPGNTNCTASFAFSANRFNNFPIALNPA